ncbi:MAG TPA: OmpA family protein [Bacteroidales bacterium]|nr:OmpA family protein [Bacteroidales bacterium]
MKLKKISVIAAVLMFAFTANINAQKARFTQANRLYDVTAYANALPRYVKVLEKDSTNNEALIKLADCYRRLNDMENAVKTYEKVINKGIAQPVHKLYYAQALMEIKNYDKAKKYMAEYNSDSRGGTFVDAIDNLDKFFRDTSYYKIERLPFNSVYNDFSPRILNDKIVYASSRKRAYAENHINTWTNEGFFKLYYTKKLSNGKYKCVRTFPYSLDNRFNSGPVSFNKQSNVIYITRNNVVDSKLVKAKDGQAKMQIYAATMNKKGTAYQNLFDFKYNDAEHNVMHPAISDDGNRLYFVSDVPGGKGGYDIWVSTKGKDNWLAPVNLGESINTPGDEAFPYVQGNKLYFSSNGLEGIGGHDIFSVTLNEDGLPSETPKNIGVPVNSTADDFGIVYYSEGNKGLFSSNRINLNLDDDIFEFTVNKPEKQIYHFLVTDSARSPLESNMDITDNKTGEKSDLKAKDGIFEIELPPGHDFNINASSGTYYPKNNIAYTSPADNKDTFEIILKRPPYFIAGTAYEKTDDKSVYVDSALIEITDPNNNIVYSTLTNTTKRYHSPELLPNTQYKVTVSRNGYFTTSEIVPSIPPGGILVDLFLSKIIVSKPIKIENIYFDYDQAFIRPDAAIELNKIVKLLQENPDIIIELGSHTDCRGSKAYNNELSENRAQSSMAYIVSKGINQSRITAKGYGETRLINNCECEETDESPCSEEEHQYNRRTEFTVTGFVKGVGNVQMKSEKGTDIIIDEKPKIK